MSRNQRLALLGLAVIVLVVGFVIARAASNDDSAATTTQTTVVVQRTIEERDGQTQTVTRTVAEPAKPTVPTVVVRDGKPVGPIRKLQFQKGGTIDFKVRATAPGGEVHFHGYDVHETVPADGGTVRFRLPAKIDGRFVVEMEATGEQIAQVEVQP